jgi:O-antigen/teichoic acid export membrane protein
VRHEKASRKHFISFGGRFSVIGFLEFLSSNLDAILIGKFFGEAISGLYNRALLVANLPIQQPANVFSRALFPLLSKMDDSKSQQLKALELSVLVVGGYAFAVSAGISAASVNIISVLLGEKWLEAASILEILSFSVGPLFVSHVFGVTYDSLGKLNEKLRIQSTALVLLAVLILLGLSYGIQAIAWSIVIAEMVRMLLYLTSLHRVFGIAMRSWFPIYICHFTLAVLAYLCIFSSNLLLHFLHPALQLAMNILAGMLAIVLAFFLLRKTVIKVEGARLILSKFPRLAQMFTPSKI